MGIIMRKNRVFRSVAMGVCVALLLLTFLASAAADAASVASQPALREVGSSTVYLYNSRRLTGSPVDR